MRAPFPFILLLCLLPVTVAAQQTCPPLRITSPDPSRLLLTSQQEMDLGDILAERMQSDFLVIDEDSVTGYLRSVGNRVARQLPSTDIRFQFFLYDQPELEAFSLPGGRVYVSRKLIAFLRSEDELAGLLGHEMGHIATRQGNLYYSRMLRDVLGVQSLRDREDVFDKYNDLMESRNLRKAHPESRTQSDRDQMIADRVGIEATVRAGYAPQPYVDSLDRIMETKGKTGSWLSDLFGATSPDARRLRELLKNVTALSASCVDSRPVGAPAEFRAWQDAVLRYRGIGHAEKLHNVLFRKTLNDPLRGDIENFCFSPDGKYILAQDEGGIAVLTRDPLAFKFRFDTHRAQPAHFSPDSRQIVFATRDLHVETWDLESQERTALSDLAIVRGCAQTELSPDGKFLACFNSEFDLSLHGVVSGQEMFRKNKLVDMNGFVSPLYALTLFLKMLAKEDLAVLRFSPDSHYFAAVVPGTDPILLSLPDAQKVKIPGGLRTPMTNSFTFLGPERLLGIDPYHLDKSPVVAFPSGNVLSRVSLGSGALQAAANPRYVLVRPIKEHPLGAYDLEAQKWVFANRSPAADIWDDMCVGERLTGEIALYKIGETKPLAVLKLPLGRIGSLRTASVSPDLHWLAASLKSRGAVWDLQQNQRIFFNRGFQSSFSVTPEIFYMSFPELRPAAPALMAFSAATQKHVERVLTREDDLILLGKISIRRKHPEKERDPNRNVTFDVIETEKGQTLWTKTFANQPPTFHTTPASGRLIFIWPAKSDGAKEEVSHNPDVKPNLAASYSAESDYFIEVLDASTGKLLHALSLNSAKGLNSLDSAASVGDWLVLSDSANRVILVSLSRGNVKARYFASGPVLSPAGNLLSVSNDRGQLRIYDLRSWQRLDDFAFSNNVVVNAFSEDGKKLLVMTDDQTVYLLDMTKTPPATAAAN